MTYGKFGKPSNKPVCLSLFTRFINTRIYLMTADWSVSAEKKKKSQCAFIQKKGETAVDITDKLSWLVIAPPVIKNGEALSDNALAEYAKEGLYQDVRHLVRV